MEEDTIEDITEEQIQNLAKVITKGEMETLAKGVMGLHHALVKNSLDEHGTNLQEFKADMIRRWCYKNPEGNQVRVSFDVY